MSEAAKPVIGEDAEPVWFLGTLVRVLLDGEATGGRFGLVHMTLPHNAAPPLHSHPQDETFYILDGEVTVWLGDESRPCHAGATGFAPAGSPHGWRVVSGTAQLLILSTPAGIEEYIRDLSEPADYPWLPPPADGPRVSAERLAAVEERHGVVRHGPLPDA